MREGMTITVVSVVLLVACVVVVITIGLILWSRRDCTCDVPREARTRLMPVSLGKGGAILVPQTIMVCPDGHEHCPEAPHAE